MRKDVKFGLTVGAILVATLVVYVIVLSGGGLTNSPQKDSSTTIAIKPTESAPPSPIVEAPAPAPTRSELLSSASNPPAVVTPPTQTFAGNTAFSSPETQPSASAQQKFDWNYGLDHGGSSLASADPVKTETPSIDSPAAPTRMAGLNTSSRPPTIDGIIPLSAPMDSDPPATQPAPEANVPASTMDPTPAAAPIQKRTHIIATGENLWTIAQSVYGNGSYYTKIVAANPGLDPKNLKVGKALIIPDLPAADKSAAKPASDTSSAEPIDASKNYRIVSGDTLEKISRKLYGNATMQDKIYDLNKTLIGEDPDKLKVGWVLKLPQPPTAAIDAPH